MSIHARLAILAVVGALFAGCESVPQHEIGDLYPVSGPVGLRTGLSFQQNIESQHSLPYYDMSDFWPQGIGAAVELPIDVDPYWGGFVGVGFENFMGDQDWYEFPDGGRAKLDMDSINLVPIYVGLTGRIPYWLDEEAWKSEVDPVWFTKEPVGFAPYARGLVGGAILISSPDAVVVDAGSSGLPVGQVDKVLDYQILPFFEGSVGLEYRERSVGYWAEVGYRYYLIPDRENGAFGDDRMARMNGVRVMVGLTWYLW